MAAQEPNSVHVFVSYSHNDRRWLDRLQIHLMPLMKDYELDLWDDTRIRPGSRWRDEIRDAVKKANAAVLLISADFLASEFIRTNELPPLLKSAEEEGALILPVIVSPSLFLRNPQLSQFQTINNPSTPLISASDGERETAFVRVAEALLERLASAGVRAIQSTTTAKVVHAENFLEHSTWILTPRIGDWILDEQNGRILGAGMRAYLLSRDEYGDAPFSILTTLKFTNFTYGTTKQTPGMNAGIIFGWKIEKEASRYYNVLLTGSELLVERIGFKGGSESGDYEHITEPVPLMIENGKPYTFQIDVKDKIDIAVNGRTILSLERPTGALGRVGLRPWRSQMECTGFRVESL